MAAVLRRVGPGDGSDDVVAFDVGVLVDLVSDLQGKQGQPDAAVIGAGAGQSTASPPGTSQPAGQRQNRTWCRLPGVPSTPCW